MTKGLKISGTICALLGFALSLGSCISDKRGHCPLEPQTLSIKLSYTTTRAASDDINKAYLYVFDKSGNYAAVEKLDNIKVNQPTSINVLIPEGDYSFVVWTDQDSPYTPNFAKSALETQKPSFAQMQLSLDVPSSGRVDAANKVPHLFHGTAPTTKIGWREKNEVVVPLVQLTNELNFTVYNLTPDLDTYAFKVEDDNNRYAFDGSIIPGANKFFYKTTSTFGGNPELKATMNIMRLASDRAPQFTLKNENTGEVLFTTDLVQLIKDVVPPHALIDFDLTSVYDIKLRFVTTTEITIEINGWVYTIDGYDMH